MENRIPLRTYFDSLLQRVELQIQDYEDNAGDPLTLCRQCVDYLQEALVYQTELRFPSGSVEVQKAYLRSEIERISAFFQKNLSFYQYYRTKATYLDNKYFLRGKPDIQILVDNFHYETDPQFSTSYDFKTAKIIANGLLEIYLTNRLNELDKREQRKEIKNGYAGKPVDLGDFYHCYMELKAKAKDSTSFLTLLRERLRMRMDEQD